MLNLIKQRTRKIKREKIRKILGNPQPNFQHYVKKIEAQAQTKWFSYKKNVYSAGIVDWTKEELTNIEGPKGSW